MAKDTESETSAAMVFCRVFFILIWLLGLLLSWVYYGVYADSADSTHVIAEAGAVIYVLTVFGLLRWCNCCQISEDSGVCSRCNNHCVLLVAIVGGFLLPFIAAILMFVCAVNSSETGGKALAGMTATCAFVMLPVSCYIWCTGINK